MLLELAVGLALLVGTVGTAPVWRLGALKLYQGMRKGDMLSRAMERDAELEELHHRTKVAAAEARATVAEYNLTVIKANAQLSAEKNQLVALPASKLEMQLKEQGYDEDSIRKRVDAQEAYEARGTEEQLVNSTIKPKFVQKIVQEAAKVGHRVNG